MSVAPDERNPVDGRVLRGVRSRERIVQALFELVRAGSLRPTAEEVARRAGVGTRSVFRHFDDMESLHAELQARARDLVEPLLRAPREGGTLPERVADLVARRARIYERIAPFKRSGDLHRFRSEFLTRSHARMTRELRADLLASLGELESAPDEVVEAADLLLSFEAWDRLRTDQKLARARAEDVLAGALLALVEGMLETP